MKAGNGFAADVRRGLRARPKVLPAKYFYDAHGSRLFEAITELPEYYPTRTETAILRRSAGELRGCLGGHLSLVELGSGSSTKTIILLERLLDEQDELHYFPIDISASILEETAERLDERYPELAVTAIASEYGAGLQRASRIVAERPSVPDRKLVLFLGSSIGNLEPPAAKAFLRRIRDTLSPGDGLLVGFDLQKDRRILHAAYNDAAGVTAAFNKNLLARINRELDGGFDLDAFSHRAFYNEDEGRIEMHLVSRRRQSVPIGVLGESFDFEEGETIHTESSYKYTLEQIGDYARGSGFSIRRLFTDEREWFALALLVPRPSPPAPLTRG